VLVTLCCAQGFQTSEYFASDDCSGDILFINAVFDISGSCEERDCVLVEESPGVGSRIQLCGGIPDIPGNLNAYALYSQQDCDGGITAVQAYPSACGSFDSVRSVTIECEANNISITTYDGQDCNGTGTTVSYSSCTNEGGLSYGLMQCVGSHETLALILPLIALFMKMF